MTIVLELICGSVLVITALQYASPAADRDFRRLFPIPSTVLLGGTVFVAVLAAVAIAATESVVVIASISVICIPFGLAVRTAVGKALNEPPGSRSIVSSIGNLAHRDAYSKQFEQLGPIVLSTQFGRTVVCVLGIDRGQRLLREFRSAIGPSPLAFSQQLMGGFLRYMDDSTHDFYGPMFRRAMSRAVTEDCQPLVAELTRDVFSLEVGDRVDPQTAASQLMEQALLQALFGVDPRSAFGHEFLLALRSFGSHAIHHRGNRAAKRDLEATRLLVHRAASGSVPQDRSCALGEIRQLHADQPDAITVDNLLFMWRIGASNSAALLTWALQHVGEHPDLRSRLAGREPGLAEAVVMESLRLSQSEYVYRKLKTTIEFEGFRLRRGWMIRICVAESHLDSRNFACPHDFTDRFLDSRPSQSSYAPFGFDRHSCNAGGLASAIVATSLAEILAHPDITINPSRTLQRSFRHWSHWRPGSDLALTRATS